MTQRQSRTKITFTAAERKELWERWRLGESVSDIARALQRKPGTIHTTLSYQGGISPRVRTRNKRVLNNEEREQISRGLCSGSSIRSLAKALERAPSTVSREVNRNGGRDRYRAQSADTRAWKQALRPKDCKLATHGQLRRMVANKLRCKWSPEQISGWLREQYGDERSMTLSHESIYRSVYIQTRGVLKKELMQHLRRHRVMRKGKTASTRLKKPGSIQDEVTIADRPAIARQANGSRTLGRGPHQWQRQYACCDTRRTKITVLLAS